MRARRIHHWPLAGLIALACACSGSDLTEGLPDAGIEPEDAAVCETDKHLTLFINHEGGTYLPGPDNAANNVMSFLVMSRTMPANDFTATERTEILTCVQNHLAPYNITVVDQDPSPTQHNEVIVTSQSSADYSRPTNEEGWSPPSCQNGGFESVSIIFGDQAGGHLTPDRVCQLVVWTAQSNANLDSHVDCRQIGSWLEPCEPAILDEELSCGQFKAEDCSCGGTTQNPHRAMLERYGPPCTGE